VAGKGYGEFRQGWPVVLAAMLGIGLGLSPVPFYTIGVLAPELAREFGWGFGEIMGGLSVMTFAVLVASPLVGLLADRYGVRPVTLMSVVLFSLSFMAFALGTGNIVLFYVTWGVMAVAGAGTLPITWTRAVNSWFEERKGLALGLSLLGTGLFGAAIKPFTAWIIEEHGWRAAYVAIGALPLLLALPVAVLFFKDRSGTMRTAADRKAAVAAVPGMTFGQTLGDWRFWLLALAFIPISFAIGGPIPNMENILSNGGFTQAQVISLVPAIGLSVIVGRLAGGWLIDRFWAPGVAFVLLAAPAIACWIFAHGPLTYETALLSIVLIGVAAGVEFDLLAFMVARYFGMKNYAGIYGALYACFALGAGLGPVVFGRWFDAHGDYGGILIASAAMLVVGAASLLALGSYRRFEPESARADA
jgi:MFS family permease